MVRNSRAYLSSHLHPPLHEENNRTTGSSSVTLKHLERVSCFPLGVLEQGATDKGRSFLRRQLVLLMVKVRRVSVARMTRCVSGVKAVFSFALSLLLELLLSRVLISNISLFF